MIPRYFAKLALAAVLSLVNFGALFAGSAADSRDRSFDTGWRFLRADAPGAEAPSFNDSAWRKLDLPHDWSIEDLPAQTDSPKRVGPFDPDHSEGGASTGHMLGGTGWYRKAFTMPLADAGKRVVVRFDGVYMNSQVWINGHDLGSHPYGYTSFEDDLTPYLKPAGQENILAVCVRNEGKNSRWYSGSGIYRHVWLTVTDPIYVPTGGLTVTTPEVSKEKALVKITSEVRNDSDAAADLTVRESILNSKGQIVQTVASQLHIAPHETRTVEQSVAVRSPELWSPESPLLSWAEVDIVASGKLLDRSWTRFGIRKIEVDAEHGFRINGEPIKLKGGCMHHDNGPLGSAAIDRAEERRVELMKANGFNAIRTSHNPPSPAFLNACDRLGMLVIDEAFDCWNWAKNGQDYHQYFKDWAERDIASMVRRDRNHPSVVMWSIGNEIGEQFQDKTTAKMLREAVLSHDTTRPITQAVCPDWGDVTKNWDTLSDDAYRYLDVGGYNYMRDKYESDHARNPKRVMMGTESYPQDCFENWAQVEKHPYVIGDFVWTAMDYFGESGIGHTTPSNKKDDFLMPWPWYNAYCGDIDVCGFKKPQSFYRDVVWGRSPIEIAVRTPLPDGITEHVSNWGWPNETRSWTWPGREGKPMHVVVSSSSDSVRLMLNGKLIDEKPVSAATRMKAEFDVPYQPGELRAIGLSHGKRVETAIQTADAPAAIRLTADRSAIHADRNDLAYITVEVVDRNAAVVPNATIPVRFTISGVGELAATGSDAPNDASSYHAPLRKTSGGRCLAILRPKGGPGQITLKAEADGLKAAMIEVRAQ
jgi:beta-galactosidase